MQILFVQTMHEARFKVKPSFGWTFGPKKSTGSRINDLEGAQSYIDRELRLKGKIYIKRSPTEIIIMRLLHDRQSWLKFRGNREAIKLLKS